jgi:hypothetical protein
MANEFVAKNGLISQNNTVVNGLLTVTGSLIHGLAGNIATGEYSHAEGSITKAIGDYSHAEGDSTQAKGSYSHAEGQETIASGSYSHAEGLNTIALANHQHVQGQWNAISSVPAAFIVGNGTDDGNRSNLIHAAGNEVQISGNQRLSGNIYFANSSSIYTNNAFDIYLKPNVNGAVALLSHDESHYILVNYNGTFANNLTVNGFRGTGSLQGTASFAATASLAPNYLLTSATSSMTVLSSSFASTASFVTVANRQSLGIPYVIYNDFTPETVTGTTVTSSLSTFGFTVADTDWPLGGVVKILFAMDRTAGSGQSFLGTQVNGSNSRWVAATGTSLVGELNILKENANTLRVHYGPNNTGAGSYQVHNATSVSPSASSGNYVFSFLSYVQATSPITSVAFRYMKALMIP